MTRKLYYEDCHLTQFSAQVKGCEKCEKGRLGRLGSLGSLEHLENLESLGNLVCLEFWGLEGLGK